MHTMRLTNNLTIVLEALRIRKLIRLYMGFIALLSFGVARKS